MSAALDLDTGRGTEDRRRVHESVVEAKIRTALTAAVGTLVIRTAMRTNRPREELTVATIESSAIGAAAEIVIRGHQTDHAAALLVVVCGKKSICGERLR